MIVCVKGVEMLVPACAYFCRLCGVFAGDPVSATKHLSSQAHGGAYARHLYKKPNYEASLTLQVRPFPSWDWNGLGAGLDVEGGGGSARAGPRGEGGASGGEGGGEG